jgi:hypothetical protein
MDIKIKAHHQLARVTDQYTTTHKNKEYKGVVYCHLLSSIKSPLGHDYVITVAYNYISGQCKVSCLPLGLKVECLFGELGEELAKIEHLKK